METKDRPPAVDQPLSDVVSGTAKFYDADGLGSITSLADISGALTDSYTTDTFGKTTASSGTTRNPFRYTARDLDSETGLMYYRARYYDSQAGRFLSEDPARPMDESAYAYAENDPVNYGDPSGLYRVKICLNTMKLILTDNNGKPIFCPDVKAGGCPTTLTPKGKFTMGAWQQDKTSPRWGNGSKTKWSDSWFGYNVFGAFFVPVNTGPMESESTGDSGTGRSVKESAGC